mgnify:CR=1 FL=1
MSVIECISDTRLPKVAGKEDEVGQAIRRYSWKRKMKMESIESLDIYWYATHTDKYVDCPSILEKKLLKKDAETQLLEDVICLVFLEYYLDPFVHKHDREKLKNIILKTWNKMSEIYK